MERMTLTAQEVADYIGVHTETIYRMVKQKQIPHFRMRRRIFFSKDSFDQWIKEQEIKAMENG